MSVTIKIVENNVEQFFELSDEAIEKALNEIGMTGERDAKKACPVDTGLLRNSITYALDGKGPNITQYKADNGPKAGSYSGTAPADGGGSRSVYIGTNVNYAKYIELGHKGPNPRPFLRPAANNPDKFARILKKNMENA